MLALSQPQVAVPHLLVGSACVGHWSGDRELSRVLEDGSRQDLAGHPSLNSGTFVPKGRREWAGVERRGNNPGNWVGLWKAGGSRARGRTSSEPTSRTAPVFWSQRQVCWFT